MSDIQEKAEQIAQIINGEVKDESNRVAVCVKGVVLGHPATFEAIQPGWPFGVMYALESRRSPSDVPVDERRVLKLSVYPRVGRGLWGLLTRLLLFESRGNPIGNRDLENLMHFNYDDRTLAEYFIHCPDVATNLVYLEEAAKFSEVVIKTDTGIYLAQPTNFHDLDIDLCLEIFRALSTIAQRMDQYFNADG